MAQVEIIAANLKNNIKDSVKKIIKRVCAYCRVSTDSEEQQTSYSSQIKHYSEQIKSIDPGTYEFLLNRGIESKYCMAIHNTQDGSVIGFVCIEYIKKESAKPDLVD